MLEGSFTSALDVALGFSLFPARVRGSGWSTLPLTTCVAGANLRRILGNGGFEEGALGNIGAHSLKATCLSWAAKFGMQPETRRFLGYHRTVGDRSTATYSRDELAGPLRSLVDMLTQIKAGMFNPDATRSGYLDFAPFPPSSAPSSSTSSGSNDDLADHLDIDEVILNEDSGILHRLALDSAGCRLERGRPRPLKGKVLKEWDPDQRLCKVCF